MKKTTMEKLGEIKHGKRSFLVSEVKAGILVICFTAVLFAIFFISESIKNAVIISFIVWISSLLFFITYWKIRKQPIPDWFKNAGNVYNRRG